MTDSQTGSQTGRPTDVADRVVTAGERETLEAFLDYLRGAVVRKVRGVSEEAAWRQLVPSATTIAGVVKHLRWVEMGWFQGVVAGRSDDELPPVPWSDADPDGEFRREPGETLEQVIATYEEECARSREAAASRGLDDTGQHSRRGAVSLRWVYVHMIEETGRHAGHVDILREQIDGVTGD